MNVAMRCLSLLATLSIAAFGCSNGSGSGSAGSGGGGAGGGPGPIEDAVRTELFLTQGFTPAPNPESNEATPTELNQARVVRYLINEEPAPAPRAIVVAVPGFLGGGPSFDGIARSIVKECASQGFAVEVWGIDRRSNGLEDLTGMNAGERESDPEIAHGYYFGGAEVDGQTFAGYAPQEDVSYMSEWGLETHIEDLRAVVDLIPEAEQRGHVFMAGHSFGASLTEQYAAWRFASDGTRGAEQIAGMIFLDGLMGDTPSEQDAFETSLDEMRADGGTRYTTLPLLGIDVYAIAEIVALRAWFDPEAIVEDEVRDEAFAILTLSTEGTSAQYSEATNGAALGLAFDSAHQPLSFVQTTVGSLTGGEVEEYPSLVATFFGGDGIFLRPSDPEATYNWIDAFDAAPPDFTPIRNLARSFTIGDSNFAEWYFPSRISLDSGAARGANIPDDGWQATYGIRAFDGSLNDAPALCILATNAERCGSLKGRIAPALGAGRPHEGATRETDLGLTIIEGTGMAHLDVILSDERAPANPVPNAIANFLEAHTEPGTVTLPDL